MREVFEVSNSVLTHLIEHSEVRKSLKAFASIAKTYDRFTLREKMNPGS